MGEGLENYIGIRVRSFILKGAPLNASRAHHFFYGVE